MEASVMASIQVRQETGCLIVDFYFGGVRCREQTTLKDNPANRKRLQKLLDRIESEIEAGTFEYRRFFEELEVMTRNSPF